MIAVQLPSSVKALEAEEVVEYKVRSWSLMAQCLTVNNRIGYYNQVVLRFWFRWYLHLLLNIKARRFVHVHALSAKPML